MSGPQGSDPGNLWQPPGEPDDRSSDETQVGMPWQQPQPQQQPQQPDADATWHAPAYTPPADYPQYQQPADQAPAPATEPATRRGTAMSIAGPANRASGAAPPSSAVDRATTTGRRTGARAVSADALQPAL